MMKNYLALLFLLSIHVPLFCAAEEVRLRPLADTVERLGRIEFAIDVDVDYVNPFDPREVDLTVVFNTPAGQQVRVPAFFAQLYDRQDSTRSGRPAAWYYPQGMPVWRARYAPGEVGEYSALAELKDKQGLRRSAAVDFKCTASESRGFVRVSRGDPRFFEFSNGQPFFPIGQNLAFIGESQQVTPANVRDVFEQLSRHGANYVRIWTGCHDWALAIEARKSAWGRSWSWHPPFEKIPDADQPELRCVRMDAKTRPAVEISPSHSVALRSDTQYILSARARLDPQARLQVGVGGRELSRPLAASEDGSWQTLELRFTTHQDQRWLERTELRVTGEGSAWIDQLSLKQADGGPELLWEAAVNRPERGFYNPLDCAQLDDVVAAAQQHGIYLQVCLLTRDAYMADFKDDTSPQYERAIIDAKNLLRYAVARWGYATSVATWEYFNENDPGLPMERFYREVGEYLQQTDVYGHLRSTSTWHPSARDCQNPHLDVASVHFYLRPVEKPPYADEAEAALGNARWLRENAPAKPALIDEFGLADLQWGQTKEMRASREIVDFHNGLWASALSGASGTAMFWWWDRLEPRNHYPHYRPLAQYLADIPWTTSRLQKIAANATGPPVRLIGLQAVDRAYFWLFDPLASWDNVVIRRAEPEPHTGMTVEIAGLQPGNYHVEWWDTRSGDIVQRADMQSQQASLRLTVPDWHRDVACKVVRADESGG